jgi:hypothetical protein
VRVTQPRAVVTHLGREVAMTKNGSEHLDQPRRPLRRHESLDEQVRRRGLKPIKSVDDLVCEGAFETDEELDAFLAWYHAERRANLA